MVSFPGNITTFDSGIIRTLRADSKLHKDKATEFLRTGFEPVNKVIHYLYQHGWETDPKLADVLLKETNFHFGMVPSYIRIAKPSISHTLPALDRRSIKHIAKVFIGLTELKKELWDAQLIAIWKTFGVEGNHYKVGGKRYRDAINTNAPPSVFKLFQKLEIYGRAFEDFFYKYNVSYTEITQPTADGLLRWLNQSVID